MRTTLTQDGTLTITPETPLEAYALACWQRAGKRGKHGALGVGSLPPSTPLVAGTGITISNPRHWDGTGWIAGYPDSGYTLTGDAATASAGTCP